MNLSLTESLRRAKLKLPKLAGDSRRYNAALGRIAKMESKLAPAPTVKKKSVKAPKYTATDGTPFTNKAAMAKYEKSLAK